MDFPLFYLDFVGNRLLMAVVAVTHVIVNHPLAVGAWPLVALMEWWAVRRQDTGMDELLRKVTFVLFIVTTSVGALTGVGIWLSAALIAPFGIGALLRIFFWAWFTEWLVFISEVVLVLVYFLMWKRWREGNRKRLHIATGAILALFSWLTMAIIVAILGFMMGTGNWTYTQSFFSAFFNPLYLPQLAFRTSFAFMAAGLFVWFLLFFFTRQDRDLRHRAVRFLSRWVLAWLLPCIAAGLWYAGRVPDAMMANLDVALLTQRFSQWEATLLPIIAATGGVVLITALVASLRPRLVPRLFLLVPFLLAAYMLAHFERVREFVRKPHVVADYMYSNGVLLEELPIFKRDGILTYATYVSAHRVTEANKLAAGKDVFMIACSRCHTTGGVNGVLNKFTNLYGPGDWDAGAMSGFIETMHTARTFMPPFPGNDKERDALVAWLLEIRRTEEPVFGAQTVGIEVPASTPLNSQQGGLQ